MRLEIALLVVFLGSLAASEATARDCSRAERQNVLQAATADDAFVRLDCNLTLVTGETVTKQIRILGAEASGLRLVCRGGVIGIRGKKSLHFQKDMIQIRSEKRSGVTWSRPENVVIDGCIINGAIRISGLGPNGQARNVKSSSRNQTHTRDAQTIAPRGIVLRNLVITGDGRIPVYFSPGVTDSHLVDSSIRGSSVSSGVYLDAESAHNTITGNDFYVSTPRENLSIDGSAHNIVANNRFHSANRGGVYIYRNCGEGGAARHQKPQFNQITNNRFEYDSVRPVRPTVWISYRSIERTVFLCPQDRQIRFGSGVDDRNFADQNVVSGNTFVNSPTKEVIRNDGANNQISSNRSLRR